MFSTSPVGLSSAARDASEPALARVRKMSYFDLSESETKVSCTVEPGGPAFKKKIAGGGARRAEGRVWCEVRGQEGSERRLGTGSMQISKQSHSSSGDRCMTASRQEKR